MLTARERSILACVIDTVVAPEPPLPPVAATDAVPALEAWLERAPRANRAALRVALLVLEAAPRLSGRGRFRRLPAEQRLEVLRSSERVARPAVEALRAFASAAYYGDDGVSRLLGYDAGARLATARRARERAA